jgi:hypothetical protein
MLGSENVAYALTTRCLTCVDIGVYVPECRHVVVADVVGVDVSLRCDNAAIPRLNEAQISRKTLSHRRKYCLDGCVCELRSWPRPKKKYTLGRAFHETCWH